MNCLKIFHHPATVLKTLSPGVPESKLTMLTIFLAVMLEILSVHSSVQALSSGPEVSHTLLRRFDILTADDVQERSYATRESSSDGKQATKTVHFKSPSLGRDFSMLLHQADPSLSPGFRVFTIDSHGRKHPYHRYTGNDQIFEGKLEGEPQSDVHLTHMGSSKNSLASSRLITAHIKTSSEMFVVEPSYLHYENLKLNSSSLTTLKETMIAYNIQDYEGTSIYDLTQNQCQPIHYDGDLNFNPVYSNSSHPEHIKYLHKRTKRSAMNLDTKFRSVQNQASHDKTRCSLLVVVDTLFYRNIGRESVTNTVNYVLALIDRVNKIFLNTTWTTDENPPLTGFGFTVQEVIVHDEFYKVSDGKKHYNMAIDEPWEAREFLENFSLNIDTRWYCLAHLLTHRKFSTSVLGLAFVASPRLGSIGGICSERADTRGQDAYYNTGISTSKTSVGETLITRQADLVVAHELGHNFGAEHDPERCMPKSSKGGAYLMHSYSVTGFEKNHRTFSPCSRESIAHVLKRKAEICFSSPVDGVCGNGVVDKGEECDGGSFGLRKEDSCCDETCHLKAGSQCSDTHSLCCTNCQINAANSLCRQEEPLNCKQASFCDGMSSECPPPPPVDNGTNCVGRGLCLSGECLPFCESIGHISCLCENKGDECRLCCRSPLNDTCTPYNRRDPHLPDGTICYRGICDKGRCEEAVQDFVERFWDIVEDISISTLSRFLMDNIVGVILFASIPIWMLCCHFINQFDRRLKEKLEHELDFKKANFLPRNHSQTNAFVPSVFGDETLPQASPSPIGFKLDPNGQSHQVMNESMANFDDESGIMLKQASNGQLNNSQHVIFDEVDEDINGHKFYSTRV